MFHLYKHRHFDSKSLSNAKRDMKKEEDIFKDVIETILKDNLISRFVGTEKKIEKVQIKRRGDSN